MIRQRVPVVRDFCHTCADDILIPVADITLILLDGLLTFDCPKCDTRIERPSPSHVEVRLLAGGCRLVLT